MSRGKREKIPVNVPQAGLNAAFSALQLEGLPEGPESPLELAPGETESPGLNFQNSGAKPGRVILRREKAHRGGKSVLVVDGFGPQHGVKEIEALARKLRLACGAGGTIRDRTIEIQGDQPARVRRVLEAAGFQVGGER